MTGNGASFVRRTFIRGAVAASLALPLLDTAAPALARGGTTTRPTAAFRIPSAAITRPLGIIPNGPTTPAIPGLPNSVPGLGIPLGGIGAGSFMLNQSGTFGPWFFGGSQDDSWEMRILPQAAFHIREQYGRTAATVRTLAMAGPEPTGNADIVASRGWGAPLSGWNLLQPGNGTYKALYPFAWTSYTGLRTGVTMRSFSPIIAGEDRRSSLPVAYFDIALENPERTASKVSLMFTMPNASAHVGRQPDSIRTGLSGRHRNDPRAGIQGVTLRSDSSTNTPDATKSEWTLAVKPTAGQHVSYATSWDASGDGADVYAPFSTTGALPDGAIDESQSAGALNVQVTLPPGGLTTVSFALSWDFPQVAFANNRTVWMRRYTNFYGARETNGNDYVPGSYPFGQSFAIARDALTEHDDSLHAVERWWCPIAENAKYPESLRGAALNQLAQVPWKTSLWEGGLVSNTVPPTSGARLGTSVPGTHLYLGLDSNAGGGANGGQGTEVGTYSYLAYTQVFPSIERDRMQAKIEAVLVDPSGDPWDPGVTSSTEPAVFTASGDPFITWTQGTNPSPGTVWFIDRPSENLFRMYDYARRHDDRRFLRRAYPAMKKLLQYMQATVPKGSTLPEAPSMLHPDAALTSPLPYANVFDVVPVNRVDAYTSQLYLLAIQAIIASGRELGESRAVVAGWERQFTRVQREYESVFWNADHQYYRYTPGPSADDDAALLGTFLGQHLAETAGLGDLVDPKRYRQHLATQYALAHPKNDSQGRSIGWPNMVLPDGAASFPYVGPLGAVFEEGVWPSVNYSVGATYIAAGRRFRSEAFGRDGVQMASAVARQIWDVDENGYQFNAPLQWSAADAGKWIYPAFESNLAVWMTIDAIDPVTTRSPH